MFGYQTSEALRLRIETLLTVYLKEKDRADVSRNAEAERGLHVDSEAVLELSALRGDDTHIWVEVSTSFYQQAGGADEGRYVFAIMRDVTERKKAEMQLQEIAQRYRVLIEHIPAVTYIQEATGSNAVTYVSPQMETMLGYKPEECTANPDHWTNVLHPEDRERVLAEDARTNETGEPFSMEYRQFAKDGRVVWVRDEATLVRDREGRPGYWLGVQHDITERKEGERRLREAEIKYRTLVEQIPAVTYIQEIVEPAGRTNPTMYASPQVEAQLGYPPQAFLEDPELWIKLLHPEDRERVLTEDARTDETGEAFRTEYRQITRDGRLRWIRDEAVLVKDEDNPPRFWQGVQYDITESKRTEDELRQLNEDLDRRVKERTAELLDYQRQLKALVRKLMGAQEEERRRVAREVHDGLVQTAIASHLRLQTFAKDHSPPTTAGKEALDRALELADHTVVEARRVIEGLRPAALDDFGLSAAVRLLVEELRTEGWRVAYEDALGEQRLPTELETALYRIIQEALANVRKHAETTEARVALGSTGGNVRLEVKDFGRGFDPETVPPAGSPGERMGLTGMRERIALLHGHFEIRSGAGEGTTVLAEAPLQGVSGERTIFGGKVGQYGA
jgi:PAS domain S-box-containing protein